MLADGSRVYAESDPAQGGDDSLSAGQYLSFTIDSPPIAIGCDFEQLSEEIALSDAQKDALAEDLLATQVG